MGMGRPANRPVASIAPRPHHRVMTDDAAALEASLALAIARAGDPQPAVYARLFALHPAMEREFWRDTSGSIRGEMLTRSIEVALDLAGPRGWAPAFLQTELVTHNAYGIDPAVFAQFLPIIAEVIAAACGDDFTPAMQQAWARVLAAATAALADQAAASPSSGMA